MKNGWSWQFDDLHQLAVGRKAAEHKARLLEFFAVGVVEFVAVAVALVDDERAVKLRRPCVPTANWQGCAPSRIVPPFLVTLLLLVQHGDDRMRRVRIKFRRVRLGQLQDVARKFDGGDLHAQAQAEVGNFVFAGVLRGQDFAFDAAFAKPAGHQDAAETLQDFFRAVLFDFLGIHLHDFHAAIVGHAAVDDRLINRFVGVLQARCICRRRRCARGAAAR